MRPLFLQFSGLNGYREPQSLDFTALLAGGLFGIFGPTGSGKSTILAAITLALYGQVERAERHTRGIINHAEKDLYVRFDFALHDAGVERVYRVERRYERSGDSGVKSVNARLKEVAGGEEKVLADKDGDVTRKITAVLGLEADDFMRAVVLPQGKFAEFLHLRGAESREMLQRLFSLQRYGEKLQARVKARLDRVAGELRAVESAQAELGDTSPERVQEAQEALAARSREVAEAEKAAATVDEEFGTVQTVWKLSHDLDAVKAQYETWRSQSEEAAMQERELALAERAEPLRPLIEAARTAIEEQRRASEQYEQAASILKEAQAAETRARQAYEQAKLLKDTQTPALLERKARLQDAVKIEEEAMQHKARAEELQKELAELKKKKDALADRVEQGEKDSQAIAQKLRDRWDAWDRIQVPPEKRRLVASALAAWEKLRTAQGAAQEADELVAKRAQDLREAEKADATAAALLEEAQKTLARLSEELARIEKAPPASEAELRDAEASLARTQSTLASLARAEERLASADREWERRQLHVETLTNELRTAEQDRQRKHIDAERSASELVNARHALEAARQREKAFALAQTLAPGVPCPVCGGVEHPHPAGPPDDIDLPALAALLEAAEATWQKAEEARQNAERRVITAQERLRAGQEQREQAEATRTQTAKEVETLRNQLPAEWQSLKLDELSIAWNEAVQVHAAKKQAWETWQEEIENRRRARERQGQDIRSLADRAASARARHEAAQAAYQEAVARAGEAAAKVKALSDEFDRVRGGYDPSTLKKEQREMEEADRVQKELREEINDLQKSAEHVKKTLDDDQRLYQDSLTRLAQVEATYSQEYKAWAEAADKVHELAGDLPPAAALDAVNDNLAALEKTEKESSQALSEAERQLKEADNKLAAATREKELAATRVNETQTALARALAQSGFADTTAATAALRPRERREKLRDWLDRYRNEGHHLERSLAELENKLAGRHIDAAAWEAVQTKKEDAQKRLQTAREQRAIAARDLDELIKRRTRFAELEEERRTFATQKSLLEELQRTLAGNALVQHLANQELAAVARAASERLGQLTRYRYALETDSVGGFVIRDDANGGVRRPVTTLSGGETFLASLALALALSAQVQLRGHYPLEFFFLDEGFGTLDPELLDVVIGALERLHFQNLHVGIITHVPELRHRIQRRVIVEPPEPGGHGSRLRLEFA